MVAQTILIYLALVCASVAHLSVGRIAITQLQAQVLSQGLRQVDTYGIGAVGGRRVLVLVAIKHGVAPHTVLQLIVCGLGNRMRLTVALAIRVTARKADARTLVVEHSGDVGMEGERMAVVLRIRVSRDAVDALIAFRRGGLLAVAGVVALRLAEVSTDIDIGLVIQAPPNAQRPIAHRIAIGASGR